MAFYSSQILAVYGEFQIPCETQNNVKRIRNEDKKQFIDDMHEEWPGLLQKMGVYIFCIRAARGTLPWYVGKTSRSLEQEILDPDKLVKYNDVLFARRQGVPCFYFLAPKSKTGKKVSQSYLPAIEEFFIATAYERNRDLANIKSTSGYAWCIDGIMGGDGDKRELEPFEQDFCKVMDIRADRREAINANKAN